MFKKSVLILFFCLPIFIHAEPLSAKAQRAQMLLEGFDQVVEKALKEYQVPGIAIGVVVDGQVVYAKGLGYRDLEKKLPVTSDTVFPIGSCTKAFTSFIAGTLIDEGTMAWDEKVLDILPDFRLWDLYATQKLTIRDLLTHRSGMPRHDYMWYTSDMSRAELMRRVRYLEPSTDIRERYQYNNLMYLSAACAMETATGKSWEDLVTARILKPLGMTNTTFTIEEMQKSKNYSFPYMEKNDQPKKIPLRNVNPVAPAASINSNVADLTRWVQLHLNGGVFNNQTLISPATLQEMHAPQVIVPGAPESKETLLYAYGIGWSIVSYRGHYYLSHDGGIDGFTSVVGFLPNEGVGIVILGNRNLSSLPRYVSFEIIDRVLEIPHIAWLKEGLDGYQKGKEGLKARRLQEDHNRKKGTSPSHPLEEYVGEYEHPGYGKINVELAKGKLQGSFNGLTCNFDHWHYDVFVIAEESQDLIVSLEGTKLVFRNNLNGDIQDLIIPFEPNTNDIIFKKKPSNALSHIAYLRQFIGAYEIYGYTVEINLKENTLYAVIPGQPLYELVPNGDKEFTVKSMQGYTVRFNMNMLNQVEEIHLIAPYGAFTAKPKK
ncbi:MAG TPA: serine hydrolase [Chlamydiales bacterium]|nr:serine hydrolase [Chlamydiales bacterium]